ncbi:hypothetical protein EXS72_03010 [Candidatus Pacearchaeota archaeon]|nr:hypothetical protein [Candidatus Pacearchaeota archaeon]
MTSKKTLGEWYQKSSSKVVQDSRLFFETSEGEVYWFSKKLSESQAKVVWITGQGRDRPGREEIITLQTHEKDNYIGGLEEMTDKIINNANNLGSKKFQSYL